MGRLDCLGGVIWVTSRWQVSFVCVRFRPDACRLIILVLFCFMYLVTACFYAGKFFNIIIKNISLLLHNDFVFFQIKAVTIGLHSYVLKKLFFAFFQEVPSTISEAITFLNLLYTFLVGITLMMALIKEILWIFFWSMNCFARFLRLTQVFARKVGNGVRYTMVLTNQILAF